MRTVFLHRHKPPLNKFPLRPLVLQPRVTHCLLVTARDQKWLCDHNYPWDTHRRKWKPIAQKVSRPKSFRPALCNILSMSASQNLMLLCGAQTWLSTYFLPNVFRSLPCLLYLQCFVKPIRITRSPSSVTQILHTTEVSQECVFEICLGWGWETMGPVFAVGGSCHFDQRQSPACYLNYILSLCIILSEVLYEI